MRRLALVGRRLVHDYAERSHSTAALPTLSNPANSSQALPSPSTLSSASLPALSSPAWAPFRWDPTTPCAAAPTLPAPFYHAPSVLDWERQSVFASNWLCIGHTAQLPTPGTYFTGTVLSRPYVVIRTVNGGVVAYNNVCCHHAMTLMTSATGRVVQAVGGGEGELVCGYHGWRYGVEDGRLRKATRLKGIEDFRASNIRLAGIAVEVVGPFIFAHLSPVGANIVSGIASPPPTPPPRDHLQQLHSILAPTGYASLVHCARRSYRLRCNWKVYVDNYLDGGYHVAHAHPALASALNLTDYTTTVLSSHLSLQSSPPSPTSPSTRIASPASYLHLYPNLMVNRYGPWLDSSVVVPLLGEGGGAVGCEVVMDWWCEGGMAADERAAGVVESEAVQAEDVSLCEGVQKGLESGIYVSGRYAPMVEHAMHAFHRTYYRDITSLATDSNT